MIKKIEDLAIKIKLPDNVRGDVILVDDFKSDDTSDWQALVNAIQQAKKVNASKIEFANRVYHFNDNSIMDDCYDAQITFNDLSNIVIDGQGATLLFHYIKPVIKIKNCQQVLFKDLYIDWDYDLSCPGVVEKRDGKTYIRIMDGWDTKDLPLSGVAEYDFEKWQWKMDGREMAGLDGRDMYYPDFSKQVSPGLYETDEFTMFDDGMTVIVRHYVYEAMCFNMSGVTTSDITFDSITIYHNPGHAFFAGGCGKGLHFKNCVIGRKPNSKRLTANTADGIHLFECQGDIIVENCDFSYMGDDSINFHGVWYRVKNIEGNMVALKRSRGGAPLLDVGVVLRFRKSGDLEHVMDAKIESVNIDGAVAHVTLDKALPDSVEINDFVADTFRTSSSFIIRNNHFHDHRARGMLIQATNGVIKNNKIENVMGAGIQVTSDSSFWQEGFGAANVLIEDNQLIGVNKTSAIAYRMDRHPAAINVVLDTENGVGAYPFHENIIIRNNKVVNSPGMAMFIASANNVTVQNNVFEHVGYNVSDMARGIAPDKFEGVCMVTKARDIDISHNDFHLVQDTEDVFNVVEATTDHVTISDNKVTRIER